MGQTAVDASALAAALARLEAKTAPRIEPAHSHTPVVTPAPSAEAIAAAVARLERKLAPPPPPEWSRPDRRPEPIRDLPWLRLWHRRGWGKDQLVECQRCGRRPALVVHRVTVRRPGLVIEDTWGPAVVFFERHDSNFVEAACPDPVECQRFVDRQREVRDRRRGVRFEIMEAPYQGEHRGRGWCRWCGEEIVLADPDDYRRRAREYHRGDSHEAGDRDCQIEHWRSYTYDARTAVVRRDLLAHGRVFCADCGLVLIEKVEGGPRTRYGPDSRELPDCAWECDHRIPLEDGGAHELGNLQVLCVPCHRRKTAAENRARAARRAKVRE